MIIGGAKRGAGFVLINANTLDISGFTLSQGIAHHALLLTCVFEFTFFLWQIITKQNRTLTIKLGNKNGQGVPRNLGTLSVHAEETVACKTAVQIAFRCSHLENVDLFSKSVCTQKAATIVTN